MPRPGPSWYSLQLARPSTEPAKAARMTSVDPVPDRWRPDHQAATDDFGTDPILIEVINGHLVYPDQRP